ncbi:MAG TPA: response regulator [Blastocatellia bacterium]|nr:response regulator [Blastocatellia bacterium]
MASRILLADDSITIQKVVNLTFADEGIEVVAVSSGDIAERRLAEVSPDLVLADIFMPGKNGYELCEAIKENSQFQHVPVVLLVGAFEPFDQAEANRVKADAHLTKPFESRTLVETVRRLISDRGMPTSGAPTPASSMRDEAEEAINALAPPAPMPLVAPVPNIDFSAMMPENNLDDSTLPTRTTGPLGSLAPDMSQGAFDAQSTPAPEAHAVSGEQAASEILPSMTEPIEIFEFSGNGDFTVGESANSFRLDDHEMVNDFERSDVLEAIEYSHDPIPFNADTSSLLDVNISGAGEGESWFSPDALGNLHVDHQPNDNGWQPSTDNSVMAHATEGSMHAGGSVVQESTDTSCATLLAVDEPLGEVFDAVSVDRLAHSQSSASDSLGFEFTEVADIVPSESTHFDLTEATQQPQETSSDLLQNSAEAEEVVAVEETPATYQEHVGALRQPFTSVESVGVQEPVDSVQEPPAVVQEPHSVVHEPHSFVHEPPAAVQEPPAVVQEPHSFVHEPPAAVQEPPAVVHEPHSFVHEPPAAVQEPPAVVQEHHAVIDQPPAVHEPVAVQEPNVLVEQRSAVQETPAAGEEPLVHEATADLKNEQPVEDVAHGSHEAVADLDWTTPHATTQSTAELDASVMSIHQEQYADTAVVPDPVITKTSDDSTLTAAHNWADEETRFSPIDIEAVAVEDSSLGVEHSELAPETGFVVAPFAEEPPARVENSVANGDEEAKSAAAASDLSAAAIDQIVRRVLSQLSESVVREVAWEVVPDCVERVIEQLTRESLSKRA